MPTPLASDGTAPADVAAVTEALTQHGYLPDEGLATAVFLALRLHRPLLLEGEAGVGKTEVAKVLSRWTGGELIRLQFDEVDRADDEFEAFLLEVLSDYQVTVPELGTFSAATPPVVVITSNRTRDVHDALKRRCLYHWVEHPSFDREVAIVRLRAPEVAERLARQVAAAAQSLRAMGLYKPPGVAETIDWATSLAVLGGKDLNEATVASTLGTVLKYREDQERVRESGIGELVQHALGRGRAVG